MDYEEIEVNYKELARLTGENQNKCRDIFKNHLDRKKVNESVVIKLTELEKYFKPVSSHDMRFDKQPQLKFRCKMMAAGFRNVLKEDAVVKNAGFVGAYTIYNKICSPEQLEQARKAIRYNHIHSYGEKSYNNKIKSNGSNT